SPEASAADVGGKLRTRLELVQSFYRGGLRGVRAQSAVWVGGDQTDARAEGSILGPGRRQIGGDDRCACIHARRIQSGRRAGRAPLQRESHANADLERGRRPTRWETSHR